MTPSIGYYRKRVILTVLEKYDISFLGDSPNKGKSSDCQWKQWVKDLSFKSSNRHTV